MTGLPALLIASVGIALALALIAIAGHVRAHTRTAVVVLFAAIVPVTLFAMVDLTGRPRLATLALLDRHAGDVDVLAVDVDPDKAIRLWLRLTPGGEPLALALPWDKRTAEAAQKAMRDWGGPEGQGVRMKSPFEPSLDPREQPFYPAPQPPMPPKDMAQPPVVEAPGIDA